MQEIQQPINRSALRRQIGKEYYILKRKFHWLFGKVNWATQRSSELLPHIVFHHQSFIMRPLKDVEMYLQENKRTNLAIAIQHLNTILIQPEETFSIWKLVGRPTESKGYLDGLILNQGKIEKDTGGGLCQLGNLLFWIVAHSPLEVVERHRHGFDVFPDVNRKVPFGAGATLAYNYIDLQVKNNTQNTFQLKLWLDDSYLHGELLAEQPVEELYQVVEQNHIMKQQVWGGYSRHNQVFKQITDLDGVITEELLVENHAIMMYNPFLESKR